MEAPANPKITAPRSTLERLLAPFSRIQSGGRFIPVIDGLRFLAIMAVIVFHWAMWMQEKVLARTGEVHLVGMVENGRLGVELFFAISGFILASPFARARLEQRKHPDMKAYFIRRVTRLEPPYILNLVVMFALLTLRKGGFWEQLPHLFAGLTYTHSAIYQALNSINFVAWSLEVEVQFYILAPLLATVFSISNKWFRRGVIVGAMLAIPGTLILIYGNVIQELPSWHIHLTLLGQVQYFLSGFLLADFYLTDWKGAPPKRVWPDLLFLAMLALFVVDNNWDPHWHDAIHRLALPFVTLTICYCAFTGNAVRWFFEHPLIATIGGMCYTIYLYHEVLIWIVGPVAAKLAVPGWSFMANVMLELPVVAVFVIGASSILFVLFERPFMRKDWHTRLLARLKGSPAVIETSAVKEL